MRTSAVALMTMMLAGCFSAADLDPIEPGGRPSTVRGTAGPTAEVFLFRGLGEVFSPGLDAIAADLTAAGRRVRVLASDAAADAELPTDGPLVLGGHSAGAFNAIRHARRAGRPIDLLVLIDPPMGRPVPVSANVRRILLVRGRPGEVAPADPRTGVAIVEVGSTVPVLGALWNLTVGHAAVTADARTRTAVADAVERTFRRP